MKLGKLTLKSNIFYAPLAGCSDFPFRQMAARFKPALMFCEMVKMEALIRGNEQTLRMLDYQEAMRPIGAQICGTDPQKAYLAAKILEEKGFDSIDLNCGCPVDKITKDGSGSGMLKDPERIGDVIANMAAAVNIPVTVKIRAGWDEKTLVGPQITKIAEQAGAAAISVHGRTRKQAYKGPANWDYIKVCKEVATSIKVIGNGDIFSGEDGAAMLRQTGCDAVLVSRGTLGQPWIVEDILRAQAGEPPSERSLEECLQALLDHFSYSTTYKSEKGALIDMRKAGCWYLKKALGVREFRKKISHANSLEEMRSMIENFECRPIK
ncbi:MAG: tRNA dihydrouridine synthase DusB [Chlamydiia bacterium]|nr:tRNA dihydrouridine synthase DusB [Chlamydiia bacterium]